MNLLIRRCPYRRPVLSGPVRDLRLLFFGCPAESGATEGCSFVWLPAWLPLVAGELRITRVFWCVARGFKGRLASCSQVASGGGRWLLMAVRGHLGDTGP
jgi:hypothetical protein